MMLHCWRHSPKYRPTFCEMIEMLVPDLDPSFKEGSFFFCEENQHALHMAAAIGNEVEMEDVDIHTPLTGSPLHAPHSVGDISQLSLQYPLEEASLEYEMDSVASSLSYQSPLRTPSPPRFHIGDSDEPSPLPSRDHKLYDSGEQAGSVELLSMEDKRKAWFQNGNSASQWNPGDGDTEEEFHQPPVVYSNEGSKGSSKSSGSSFGGRNGLANGHIPHRHIPQTGKAEC